MSEKTPDDHPQENGSEEEWQQIVEALRSVRRASVEEREAVHQQVADALPVKLRRKFENEYRATLGESFEGEFAERDEGQTEPANIATADEATLIDSLYEMRKKKHETKEGLIKRFGNHGQKIEGTNDFGWYDPDHDSVHIIQNGQRLEIAKGGIHNFRKGKIVIRKKWQGLREGGWSNVRDIPMEDFEPSSQAARSRRETSTVTPIETASQSAAAIEKPLELMTPEEMAAERERLIRTAREKGIDISDIVTSALRPREQKVEPTQKRPNGKNKIPRKRLESEGPAPRHVESTSVGKEIVSEFGIGGELIRREETYDNPWRKGEPPQEVSTDSVISPALPSDIPLPEPSPVPQSPSTLPPLPQQPLPIPTQVTPVFPQRRWVTSENGGIRKEEFDQEIGAYVQAPDTIGLDEPEPPSIPTGNEEAEFFNETSSPEMMNPPPLPNRNRILKEPPGLLDIAQRLSNGNGHKPPEPPPSKTPIKWFRDWLKSRE